ncbi:MAG: heat-inducible transcriptional repressor HrcA, partial [Erysipelotrichaceae bacterium]
KTLMQKYYLPYSSATIRNDMMSLEEKGYLEKTHTSSGRIPSIKGYKFYCEHLMKNDIDMDDRVTYPLQNVLTQKRVNVDEAIRESCEILSRMTNLATGVLGPDARDQYLEHIKIFPIDEKNAVCVLITNTGHTENKVFQFDSNVPLKDVTTCCELLNDRLKGTKISDVVEKMHAIRPLLANKVERHEMLFNAFVSAFIKFASENVYFSGQNNMLYQPEFADIEKLKGLMNMLEDHGIWRNLEQDANELALKTLTGSKLMWLGDLAVISTTFKVNNEEGQFMVVGPPRMDYDRIVGIMEYLSTSIEKLYRSENNDKDE